MDLNNKLDEENPFFQGEEIINVWQENLEEEIDKISDLIQEGFTHISIDTEFPGILYT